MPRSANPLIWDKDRSVHRLMNNETLLMRVVSMFIEETPDRMTQLRVTADSGDLNGLREQAHTLKGSAFEVGAQALADAFASIEKNARQQNLAAIIGQFGDLDQRWQQFLECVKASE